MIAVVPMVVHGSNILRAWVRLLTAADGTLRWADDLALPAIKNEDRADIDGLHAFAILPILFFILIQVGCPEVMWASISLLSQGI